MDLFDSSQFSSKNDDALRDFELDVSSKKRAVKRSPHKLDPAWDDGSAFPEVSSKNIFLEEKQKDFEVGDRCQKSLIDAAVPLPTNFSLFEEFEIAWKDWIVTQTEWQEEELCCISALEVWEQERSAIKDDNDSESDRPKSQVETKTSRKLKASDCWYTPPEIITLIQQCLQGITLDPCADDGKHVESCYHLTVADDGLSHPWFGRVFMNPPYSCPGVWIAKLQAEFNSGRVEEAIALVPAATDTKWFHPLISSNLICFWKGRIKFLDVNYQPKMAARQSHCLIYWGKNQAIFRQVFSPFGSFNSSADLFLEEEGATECNLHSLTSAQGSALVSVIPVRDSDLNSSEPQKSMLTALTSSANASQECITMEVSENFQDVQREGLDICVLEESISSPLLLPALHFPQKGNDLEQMTSATASPQSLQLLENCSPNSQSLKTSPVYSPVPTSQVMSEATSNIFWKSFPPAGMMRNGLLSEADTVPLPLLEKEYCWLPSPGALSSTGKGRPPGQTKQEGELKKLGAIAPNQVINPEFLESAYNLPLGWTDPLLKKSALELQAEMESLENAAQPLVTHSIPTLERSHLIESSTSIPVVKAEPRVKAITLHQPWAYLVGRSKYFETRSWATNYRGKIAIHAAALCQNNAAYFLLKDLLPPKGDLIFGAVVAIADLTDCILMAEEFINQQSETELRCGNWKPGYYAWKLENIQILSEPIAAKGKQGLWDVELTLSEATPEKFLEETEPQPEAVPKGKGRQRKGCLYKYIETKKLKDGTVASYPRVIGHRDPSNPTHWRWGFNWEEKVDGEWKNRSLSVKLGAIPLIQSMQREGVFLEEIIGFIRRSKNKG